MDLFLRTCNAERMNIARIVGRGFVVIGGLVWTVMFFASETAARYADITYTLDDVVQAGIGAAIPAAVAVLVFVISLFYERLAALLLILAAIATVVYGVMATWEPALWVTASLVIISPLVIGAALFLVAARTQRVCELEGKTTAG
ncbi:MAG: hypothetical protein KGZ40_04920 [Clostridiales bacterium]|nr:hypothetical protein [Clostridiales bacterium]